MEELKCDICGKEFASKQQRGSHYWNQHKIKYSEYVKQKQELNSALDEMSKPDIEMQKQTLNEAAPAKAAEALYQPSQITEAKEFINEAPAMVIDRSLMHEAERKDTDFVKRVENPYKDMYNDGGQVLNEWL